MIPTDTRSREARRLADRLLGLQIPSLVLSGYPGSAVDLRELAQAFPLVIYLYPGGGWSAQDGEDTPLLDAVQHRAFRRHQRDLEARGYQLIGVSSQSQTAQREAALANGVAHALLGDPELRLGRGLGLPAFTLDGGFWYHRLTLVVGSGRIQKAFFPVSSAARSPAQVIAWMTIQGIA
jgi:peroxiredoxin